MIVCGTQHSELFRNVRRPCCSVVIRDSRFQRLPGSDNGLLGFVLWLVGNRFTGILAVSHAGAVRACFLTAEGHFVIDEQAPGGAALDPKTKNVDLVAVGHDGFHVAARLANLMRTGFVAERRFGECAKDFDTRESLAFSIGPGEIGVKKLCDGGAIALGSGLHKFAVGLENGCFFHRRTSPLDGLRE